jgi:hypothetical protein
VRNCCSSSNELFFSNIMAIYISLRWWWGPLCTRRISKKNRQHNDQNKNYKRTNNDMQNIDIKKNTKGQTNYVFFIENRQYTEIIMCFFSIFLLLPVFDIRILIAPLVSSNSTWLDIYFQSVNSNSIVHRVFRCYRIYKMFIMWTKYM